MNYNVDLTWYMNNEARSNNLSGQAVFEVVSYIEVDIDTNPWC